MVKKCKQCGCILTAGESNKICEKCRKNKREKQLEANTTEENFKKKKQYCRYGEIDHEITQAFKDKIMKECPCRISQGDMAAIEILYLLFHGIEIIEFTDETIDDKMAVNNK